MSRTETDSLGPIDVPDEAYWGAQTQRSLINFAIGQERMPLPVVHALALIKKAAARVNQRIGELPADLARLIEQAANEVLAGQHDEQFPLAVWQTGSGTQSNMNVTEVIAGRANELAGDLVVITGDIVDKTHCIDWIPETLGRLRAKHGVYFVLGNHDKRVADVEHLRRTLTQAGMKDVGGRVMSVEIGNVEIQLAGNELPWFPLRAATDLFQAQVRDHAVFRILLAHTPDQYEWAKQRGFDLMLAGHNHGGQVRLPWIGPILSPSRFGARYASGLFEESPTLLHVSRGIAGTHPLRLNCPPEAAKLVLKCAQG